MSVEVLKSGIGWSGASPRKGFVTRKYAVKINGDMLRTKSGAIRTFATREAAKAAAVMK